MERVEIPLIGLATCICIAIYDPIIKMERVEIPLIGLTTCICIAI
jgi:energy-converting hydrogenase Eha subunit E